MYAVISSGGKQHRVEAGSELVVERLTGDAGATITFDRVLLVGDGEAVTVGTPTVQGATVSGTVLGEVLGPKLIIFKFKQKATYRRKNGHRQHLTRVRIDEISTNGKSKGATAEKPEPKADKPKAEKPKPKAEAKATTAKAEPKPKKATAAKAEKKPAARKRSTKAAATGAGDEAKPKKATARRSTKAKTEAEE